MWKMDMCVCKCNEYEPALTADDVGHLNHEECSAAFEVNYMYMSNACTVSMTFNGRDTGHLEYLPGRNYVLLKTYL